MEFLAEVFVVLLEILGELLLPLLVELGQVRRERFYVAK
jgi:hypothetical protein